MMHDHLTDHRQQMRFIPTTIHRTAACTLMLLTALAITLSGCTSAQKTQDDRAARGVYAFWPPLPDEPRVQFLTSFRYSSDVEKQRSTIDELIFGSEQERLAIGKPYGVAMWDGKIYVCDIANPGVVILDLRKQQTRVMGATGSPAMSQPTDIAIAEDGFKYVVDRRQDRIFVFSPDDRQAGVIGWQGFAPVGVAVRGRELYVPDREAKQIIVVDRVSGEMLRAIGEAGGGEGQFIYPLGIAVGPQGHIYVTDAIRGRLQKFSSDGELLLTQGQISDTAGNFVRPKHIAVDSEGIIYVVDAAFQNVQMFNDEGEVLMFFGSAGSHLGSMSLPAGLDVYEGDLDLFQRQIHPSFAVKRLVLVTNQFGLNKVSVYAMGELEEGATTQDIAPFTAPVEPGVTDEPSLELQSPDGAAKDADASPPTTAP
jgi:DNA-binding beta-propeller fold protein YncE